MFIATFIFFFGNNHVLPAVLRAEVVLIIPVLGVALATLMTVVRVLIRSQRLAD